MTARAGTDFFGLQPVDGTSCWSLPVTEDMCNAGGTLWGGVGLGGAMEAIERDTGRATVWAAVQYVRPIRPDDELELRVVPGRSGRTLTQAQALGYVGNELVLSCLASLALRNDAGEQPVEQQRAEQPPDAAPTDRYRTGWQYVELPADAPPPNACPPRKRPREFGRRPILPDHFEQRWASPPRSAPYDGTQGTGRTRLWLRFARDVTPEQRTGARLAVLADLAPSAIAEAVGVPAGGISLDNTIRIARRWTDSGPWVAGGTPDVEAADGATPAGQAAHEAADHRSDRGWVLLDVTVESILGDVAQLSARVFDPAGRLLAVAGQSAIVRQFSRVE